MVKDTHLTIRMTQELKDTIVRVATADYRSPGQLVTKVVIEYLESIGEWDKAAAGGRARASPSRRRPRSERR